MVSPFTMRWTGAKPPERDMAEIDDRLKDLHDRLVQLKDSL